MLFSKRPSLASLSTATSPASLSTSPATTTPTPHDTDTKGNNKSTTPPTGTGNNPAATLLYARVHGVVFAGFIWSVWCCDHYQQGPLVTFPLILTGLFSFVWWCRRRSLTESSLPLPLPSQLFFLPPSKLTDGPSTYLSRVTEQEQGTGGGIHALDVSSVSAWPHLPTSVSASSIATASVSACSVSCDTTVSVLAQDNNTSGNRNGMGMGMSMPPTPTDPPPPYSHNNASAGASGSDDGLSSGQCMQSGEEEDQQQQQQQTVTARSRPENQQLNFTRQRLLVHAWGAGACLLGLGSWMVVSEFEPLLLPILEAKVAELELELEMGLEGVVVPFSVCCWVVVTFVWILYALATRYLVSWSGTLVDSSGSGTGTSTGTSEQLAKEEVVVVIKKEEHEQELNLELELEHKEQEFKEHGEQQEFYGNVDVETGEDLSEIGHDMNRAQQRQQERQQSVLAKMPCLRILRRSISCRQQTNHPSSSSYKSPDTTTTITIKRHRRGPAPNKTWTRSISLLQQVKNEIRIWSFSLWVLAPTIPRPFGHQHLHNYHQHRPQDVKSARDDSGREMRYPQQHGRGDKQEGGLLLATAGCQDMGETECELVRTEETSEMDRALAVKGVATKAESDNQDLTQDDERVGGDWDVFPLVEKQPSFAQTTHRQQPPRPPPQRAGYMSQSMPDLHAAKRNGVVESALARWSRMTLDPERLGSIFQYYLRQHASTLKRKRQTDGGDRDSSAATDGELHDGSSEDEDDVDDVDDYEEDEEDSGVTFVIRSSTLPTVRVGLYGADQKRLWTSSGSVHLSPMHGDEEEREEPTMSAGPE